MSAWVWCQGCDQIVGIYVMEFSADGLYRCDNCRGEVMSDAQKAINAALNAALSAMEEAAFKAERRGRRHD